MEGAAMDDRSFWDVGEPRRVLRRIENGQRSCEVLMGMIQERADVELRYAKSLRQWAAKWDDSLIKGPEYGSVLAAWRTVLQEASAAAKVHEYCRMRLTGDEGPYYNVYKWQSDHFHQEGQAGLRETQQAKEAFAAAQREYAKLLSKVQRAKKAYYSASVAAYTSRRFADDEATNPAVSSEARWKLRERADSLALERERLKQVYLRRVMVCNVTAKERYIARMTAVFDQWQEFERERLQHIQSQLELFVVNLNTHSGTGLGQLYHRILDHVRRAEPAADVDDWGRKYGTGCPANWPKYEEIDPRSHQTDGELPYAPPRSHRGNVTRATADETTDEFTTDSFDSELDAVHHHAPQRGHAHQYANRPYRSHQHEVNHLSSRQHPRQQQYRQHPLPERRYSQNEDPSERWLEEQLGRHGQSSGSSRWDKRHAYQRGHREDDYHPYHDNMHRRADTMHYNDGTKHYANVQRQWSPQDHYHEPIGHLNKGQRSEHHTEPDYQYHHTADRSPRYANDLGRSGHHLGQDQGQSSSFYDTLGTSQSQESLIHGNHPSSTTLDQPPSDGYQGKYGYPGNTGSDDILAGGQGVSPSQEAYFEQNAREQSQATYPGLKSTRGTSHSPGQTPGQMHAQAAQQTPAHQTPKQTSSRTPSQTQQQTPGQTPTETTAQTYIERWSGAAKKAAILEQAQQSLQPKEGERLVWALYDFKPSTRDEMALKQSEYLVQIGEHLTNGWAYGRKAGARGHFPASYVQ